MTKSPCIAVIPAFEPTPILGQLINRLCECEPDIRIVVIDDGSMTNAARGVFQTIEKCGRVEILRHAQNCGKGAALKTGFKYLIDQEVLDGTIVAFDADGQHLIDDVIKVMHLSSESGKPTLGVRTFDKYTPLKSLLGNRVSSLLLRFFFGINLGDTQTGLRAVPAALLPKLIGVTGERYDYELRQLTQVLAAQGLIQVPIRTIYFDSNSNSHFNPFLDSMRIYWVIFRHLIVSLIIGSIDLLILYFLIASGTRAELAVLISRMISVSLYYTAVSQRVFRTSLFNPLIIFKFSLNLALNIWLFPRLLLEVSQHISNQFFAVLVTYLIFYVFNFSFQKWVVFKSPNDHG